VKGKEDKEEEEGRSRMMMTLNQGLERGLVSMVRDVCKSLLEKMDNAGQLKCSVEEGMRHCEELGSTTTRRAVKKNQGKEEEGGGTKPSVPLPFCGVIKDDWCLGVRLNHGLHSQCTNGRDGLGDYCKTCQKGAENSASGQPPYGDMRDRAKYGLDYRNPKGKQTSCFANVAEKLGIDLAKAKAEAAKLGWEIPADQLMKIEKKRGRPSKAAESSGEGVVKKKRGRKKKKATIMSDQIAELVEAASVEIDVTNEEKESEMAANLERARVAKANLERARAAVAAAKLKSVAVVVSSDDDDEEKEAVAKLQQEKEAAAKLQQEKEAAAKLQQEKEVAENMKDLFGSDVEDDEEEEEDDAIKLTKDKLTKIDGIEYYKTKAYGFENFLFSLDGDAIGGYDEGTGLITEVCCDDSDEDDSDEE
jgi:hypothetical protein